MRKNRLLANAVVALTLTAVFFLSSPDIFACSRTGPFTFDELFVADAIVLATAEKYAKEPGPMRTTGPADAEVEFKIGEVLRGKNVPKSIILKAYLGETDDYNDMKVPYTFVRKNGRSGSCYANTYRHGGQFLLFLRKTKTGYTSNISPLGPTNEQVHGSDDPWVSWARSEIANREHH